ncbi:glycoside hydrolase superfamily [Artemisia annua]|uniref:Glycoside hydrolase superfamily n=1 Tax=Artemisia annua TaxID=35608 RepID=A0A2U1NKZ7_ARTAN|nr:glycoside hydrolase superfamily [Artemisia annua]
MASFVKSLDRHHLLEIGMEGFYGDTMPERNRINPGYQVGTDKELISAYSNVGNLHILMLLTRLKMQLVDCFKRDSGADIRLEPDA